MKWFNFAAGAAGIALAISSCNNPQSVGNSPPFGPEHWTMPNLVGTNLQHAQNKIQALTNDAIYRTTSHDAAGKHRSQVVDSNWKVCTQNVAPGVTIVKGTKIDFGTVKLAEACP
jgi:hypothetical protein